MVAFTVLWDKLSFSVLDHVSDRKKEILVNQCGRVTSGTMTAILGPSGAGKTTLLNCITGKLKDGVTGQVLVKGRDRLKISFVPQFDSVYEQFTTLETLIFASKMKNPGYSDGDHCEVADRVLKQLDLKGQRDVSAKKLSGGQKKRLCIGVELTSQVDFLVLDEPTTGLDSSTALLLINNLRDIAIGQSIAIISTIHQPSNEALNTFDMIYLMSTKGVNVYFGPPSQLVGYLVQQGIKCPKTRSIGEIAIKACFEDIPDATTYMSSCPNDDKSWKRLEDMKQKSSGSFSYETKQLWLRSFQGRAVKTPLLISSICVTAALWVVASRMTKYPIGEEDGCQMSEVNDTLTSKQLRDLVVEKNTRIRNVASIIYAVFLIMVDIYTSSTATLFGAEVSTLGREIQNGWYRVSAVFVSVIIHGVIEVTITSALSVSLFVTFSHMLDLETWRLVSFFTFTALVSFIFWLGGLCLGCLLRDKFYYLLLASSCLEIPLTMVSSFIVQPDRASALLRPYFKVNFFDHAYRGTLSVLYGFGRCDAKLARQRSLLGDFSMSQSPYKIIGDSIGSESISNDTLFTYSKLLNIDYAILSDISHKVEEQFNQFVGQDLDKTEPSYMLQRYDIPKDGQDIFYNYLCLVLALLAGLVVAFASLKRAIR